MTKKIDFEVAIIGAGFSGLGMGIRLKMAERNSFVIFERASELGGTWRDNDYPGCACDVPSHLYSFSFDPNPNWSRLFPSQPEILAYLKACVGKFEIESHIRFDTDITVMEFMEDVGYWRLETRGGETITARVVVGAMGPLNRPSIPPIPGLERFEGTYFHSSEWNHDFDAVGKTIATVGTGASAIQFIPVLAKEATQLHVFQRTAPWIMPRNDFEIPADRKELYAKKPFRQRLVRTQIYWILEIGVFSFLGNKFMRKRATKLANDHLVNSIPDPELRKAVTPRYEVGCKRVLVSDDYYPALSRENVELVTAGIQEVTANSIVDNNGVERPVDAIVFGTGFVASEALLYVKIYGRSNGTKKRELISEWKASGPEAYYGLSVPGYPNLFFLLGPNTGLGHNSVILMIEAQFNYIMDYLRLLDKKGVAYLDLKPDIYEKHNEELQEKLKKTVWQSGGCDSWYQTQQGKNTTLWPGTTIGYRRRLRRVHRKAYEMG